MTLLLLAALGCSSVLRDANPSGAGSRPGAVVQCSEGSMEQLCPHCNRLRDQIASVPIDVWSRAWGAQPPTLLVDGRERSAVDLATDAWLDPYFPIAGRAADVEGAHAAGAAVAAAALLGMNAADRAARAHAIDRIATEVRAAADDVAARSKGRARLFVFEVSPADAMAGRVALEIDGSRTGLAPRCAELE